MPNRQCGHARASHQGPVQVYWWNKLANFGDLITPLIFDANNIPFVHADPAAKLRSVIRRHDIDVIHAHRYEGLLTAAIVGRSARRPVIYDVHTTLGSELSTYAVHLPASIIRRVGQGLDRVLPRLVPRPARKTDARHPLMRLALSDR